MAIKIQGATIIDDSKNIQDNTGFYSDSQNSSMRPKSSSGASFMQRWNGSGWENIASFSNSGINLLRNVSLASGYSYSGNGSGLTNTAAITLNGYTASTAKVNSSWYSRIAPVGIDGAMEIGKFIDFHNTSGDDTDSTYKLDNYSNGNLSTSGALLVNGTLTVSKQNGSTEIGGDNGGNIELWRSSGPYIDFKTVSNQDYGARIFYDGITLNISSNGNLYLNGPSDVTCPGTIQLNGVTDGSTTDRRLCIGGSGRIRAVPGTSTIRSKEDINYIEDSFYDKIYGLTPITFKYKIDADGEINEDSLDDYNNQGTQYGLLAEEVLESFPDLVRIGYYHDQYYRNENGIKTLKEDAVKTPVGVNYEAIPIITIGALQELRQRVIDLEEEVKTLKASLQTP